MIFSPPENKNSVCELCSVRYIRVCIHVHKYFNRNEEFCCRCSECVCVLYPRYSVQYINVVIERGFFHLRKTKIVFVNSVQYVILEFAYMFTNILIETKSFALVVVNVYFRVFFRTLIATNICINNQ